MPNFVPFVLKNEANVDVTFNPVSMDNNIGTAASAAPDVLSRSRLTISTKMSGGVSRPHLKLEMPVVRALAGVDTVVETAIANLELRLPASLSTTERTRITNMIASTFASSAVLRPVLDGVESIW
jgi:hypothetical protein